MSLPLAHLEPIELHPQDFERYLPDLVLCDKPLKEIAKIYLDECLTCLQQLHELNFHSEHLLGIRSLMIDRLVIFLFHECEKQALQKTKEQKMLATLVAAGGYGRGEMNIYSDIDLLFLYPQKKGAYIEILTEKMLYILWDTGLEIGHATRTVNECKKLFFEDITIMTSLLDLRYICGEKDQFNQLQNSIARILKNSSQTKKLIKAKLEERKNRLFKNGGSVFVLEPNVKECAGTLRDFQHMLWLAKLDGHSGNFEDLLASHLLTKEEYDHLLVARNFLWRIRNEIHLLVGRKAELLTFHRQEKIAKKLGFVDSPKGILAVEQFMQTYYQLASEVASITERVSRRITFEEVKPFRRFFKRIQSEILDDVFRVEKDQIIVRSKDIFKKEPIYLMHLFAHVQKTGFSIDQQTKELASEASKNLNNDFRHNKKAIKLFRQMLGTYKNLGQTLMAMHEVHFLEEWMPEFKKLRCRVQHDSYHIYTIDTHSIFAVNELSKLVNGDYHQEFPLYEEVLAQVKKPEILTLGLFLHDIGKGEGGNHSVKGAEIANHVTTRLKFNRLEKRGVEFLILSHLMMPHLSQRRDLEDPELIIQFAESMKTMDKLNMLFLLTWGDIRAVGPEAWTNWKGKLLESLYQKAKKVLTEKIFSKEKSKEQIEHIKEELFSKMSSQYSPEEFQYYVSIMPKRYFFAVSKEEVEKHFKMYRESKGESIVFSAFTEEASPLTDICLLTTQLPEVLSLAAGVMLLYSINVIRVDVFRSKEGQLLTILRVTNDQGKPIEEGTLLKNIELTLKKVLREETGVKELLEKNRPPDYLVKKPIQKAESRVLIDNDVSAYYTVIDVYTHDRLGLLYDILKTLNQQGCYVDVSKISTKVEQVTDVFYVKDIFGQKITSKEKIQSIKGALQKVVDDVV